MSQDGPFPFITPERLESLKQGIPRLSSILGLDTDGGTISYVGIDAERQGVKVRLGGACEGCSRTETVTMAAIDRIIRERFPELPGGAVNVGQRAPAEQQVDFAGGRYFLERPFS